MPRLALLAAIAITLATSSPALAGGHNSDIHSPSASTGFQSADPGFQPVDLSRVEKMNGKVLTTIAYSIIFFVFVLYGLSLLRREQTVEKNTRKLERHLKQNR